MREPINYTEEVTITVNPLKQYALLAAWLIAIIATGFSLYSSEILHYAVCTLCWYQRLGIYPLVIILGIALYRNDLKISVYAIPLATIAAFFALYQYLEQMIPGFSPIQFCTAGSVDCSRIDWQIFGFVTFPLLSFIASLWIIVLLFLSWEK